MSNWVRLGVVISWAALFSARPGYGQASPPVEAEPASSTASPFLLPHNPDRPRSDVAAPIFSFILPGLDQWWEGQYTAAAAYTGVALAGYGYASHVIAAEHLRDRDEETELDSKDVAVRKATLGGLVAQGAGGFSAYHSFRSAVRSRKGRDQYDFLAYEETPADLLLAPFQFQFLARSTTYIPLLIGASIAALSLNGEAPEDYKRAAFTSADGFFASSFSYNAGTHEEAMFRGWVMPVMREYWGSDLWSNVGQATIFALAHVNTNPNPWPQLLLGGHLGHVAQKNRWRLAESIFIHVWWDVIAFATVFSYQKLPEKDKDEAAFRPILWLPALEFFF